MNHLKNNKKKNKKKKRDERLINSWIHYKMFNQTAINYINLNVTYVNDERYYID